MKPILLGIVMSVFAAPAVADEFAADALKEGAPPEVPEAVRKELASEATRILKDKKPFMDFWLRSALPAGKGEALGGVALSEIRPGSLLGAVRLHGPGSDFKGQKFPAGIYTLRYGVQPEDGDHQGTSESRDFLL